MDKGQLDWLGLFLAQWIGRLARLLQSVEQPWNDWGCPMNEPFLSTDENGWTVSDEQLPLFLIALKAERADELCAKLGIADKGAMIARVERAILDCGGAK